MNHILTLCIFQFHTGWHTFVFHSFIASPDNRFLCTARTNQVRTNPPASPSSRDISLSTIYAKECPSFPPIIRFFFRSRRKCARTKSPARFNAVGRNVAWNRAWIGALLDIPAQFGGARENRSNGVAPRSDRDSCTREQFRAWKFQALEMSGKEGKQPFPSSFADYARFQLTIFSSSIWTDGLLLEKFFPPASRGKLVRRKVKEILLLFGFLSCKRVRSYRFELSR